MRSLTGTLTGILVGLAVIAGARSAAAQTATFGFGFGGQGTAFIRTAALDARLAAAGRHGIGGLAGGFTVVPFDLSIGPFRLNLSIDGAFTGDDPTRKVMAFNGALLAGARLRQGNWVFLPSMGASLTDVSLCVKGPAGVAPITRGPLFDQILSAAGPGECLLSETAGMKFEIGVDRELVFPSNDGIMPSFFIGARAGLTLPFAASWKWNEVHIDGPLAPMITPTLGLVLGFRARIGE